MSLTEPVRVLLIEDDLAAREALRQLLEGTPGFACSGAFGSVGAALVARCKETPAVVLLDIQLPGMQGTEAVPMLKERWPDAVVLMLTVLEDEDRILQALCNGACGYLLKRTPPAKLLEAIAEAQRGGAPLSPEIATRVVELLRVAPPPLRGSTALTPGEVGLLGLMAEGFSYQAAAAKLGITINTVRSYIRSIYDKLHVHSKSAAVSKALRSRLL